jgi:hypothetical protein
MRAKRGSIAKPAGAAPAAAAETGGIVGSAAAVGSASDAEVVSMAATSSERDTMCRSRAHLLADANALPPSQALFRIKDRAFGVGGTHGLYRACACSGNAARCQ